MPWSACHWPSRGGGGCRPWPRYANCPATRIHSRSQGQAAPCGSLSVVQRTKEEGNAGGSGGHTAARQRLEAGGRLHVASFPLGGGQVGRVASGPWQWGGGSGAGHGMREVHCRWGSDMPPVEAGGWEFGECERKLIGYLWAAVLRAHVLDRGTGRRP